MGHPATTDKEVGSVVDIGRWCVGCKKSVCIRTWATTSYRSGCHLACPTTWSLAMWLQHATIPPAVQFGEYCAACRFQGASVAKEVLPSSKFMHTAFSGLALRHVGGLQQEYRLLLGAH